MHKVFKPMLVIIGTLIGAGFASGEEIYIFFFSYGINGIAGIVFSSVLMGFTIYKMLILIKEYKIKNYKEYLNIFMNKKKSSKLIITKNIINILINLFILITFFIMIAGFGAYFEQEIGINSQIASTIIATVCFFIFLGNIKSIIKINQIIIPIIVVILIVVGYVNISNLNISNIGEYIAQSTKKSWSLSALLYCSYNSILLTPVLITLKDFITSKNQIKLISIFTTTLIIILSVIVYFLLVNVDVDVDITKLEMPAVYVVSNISKILRVAYGIIILSSIFTTAISLGNSFMNNFSNNKKSYTHIAAIMCITSAITSQIGFSNLINFLYPMFGYLGLIQILANILKKTPKTDITLNR